MSDRPSSAVPAGSNESLRFVLFTVALLLGLDLISSIFGLGWWAITATLALMMALFIGRIVLTGDKALLGWLIFGLPPAEIAVHPSDANDVHEFYLMCDDINALTAELQRHKHLLPDEFSGVARPHADFFYGFAHQW